MFADWLKAVEPFAYGELGLLPWQLGRMTPREVRLRAEGFMRAREREAEMLIWQIQHRYQTPLMPKHILHMRPKPPKG